MAGVFVATQTIPIRGVSYTAGDIYPTAGLPTREVQRLLRHGLISYLPLAASTETFTVASQAAMLALTAQPGDVAVRTDTDPDTVYVLGGADPTVLVNWVQIGALQGGPAGGVLVGTYPNPSFAVDMATQAELNAVAAAAMQDGEAAGGVLSGTYPNPGFAVDMATQAELDAVATAKLSVTTFDSYAESYVAPAIATQDIGVTTADITGLTLAKTLDAGAYWFEAEVVTFHSVSGSGLRLQIYENGGATVGEMFDTAPAAGFARTIRVRQRATPGAGAKTFKVRAVNGAGTLTIGGLLAQQHYLRIVKA